MVNNIRAASTSRVKHQQSEMTVLAHHWLVTYRGGEKVLEQFRKLFPSAPVATLVYRRGEIPDAIFGCQIGSSPLQNVPGSARFYKTLLPLHAWAYGRLDVPPDTKFVLSSDASMVKGLRLSPEIKQVCYCHSPPRYLWDMQEEYINNSNNMGAFARAVFKWTVPRARRFDLQAAQRVDRFIANSAFVAKRIEKYYGRDSEVIHPPVNVEDFDWTRRPEDFYLLISHLVPYKRVDLAVEAFNSLKLPLIIIGEGSELPRLRKLAGPTVQLLGRQPFVTIKDRLERCKAFIYPQIEDFGITALEAQAAGKPVIAFRGGGALETIVEGQTGAFFDEQTSESLVAAVNKFEGEPNLYRPEMCRRNAERFKPERFRAEIKAFLSKYYPETFENHQWPT